MNNALGARKKSKMIPTYINCQTNEDVCDYLMVKECKNTCPYTMGLGIGACCDPGVIERLEKEIEDGGREV